DYYCLSHDNSLSVLF
nr:immunoglobulin light chain junction region [Macaca mulatta]